MPWKPSRALAASLKAHWGVVAAVAATMTLVIAVPVRGDGNFSSVPTVTAVSPDTGPLEGVVQVAVSGTNLLCGGTAPDPATKISFGSTVVTVGSANLAGTPLVKSATDTKILVDVPAAKVPGPVDVIVTTSKCGTSAPNPNDVFNYQGQCSGACSIDVLGTSATGPATGRVSEIINGASGGWTDDGTLNAIVQRLDALHLKRWHVSDDPKTAVIYQRLSNKPQLEYILSNSWLTATNGRAPWSDDYAGWNTYLATEVKGQTFCDVNCVPPPPGPISYWDVWSEPLTSMQNLGTACNFYDLARDTYQALRALVPDAKVVVPSVTELVDYGLPGGDGLGGCSGPSAGPPNSTNYIGFKDLFDWTRHYNATHAPAQQVHFAAYSFHILNDGPTCEISNIPGCPSYPFNSPRLVSDRINRLRNLLAQYPDLQPAEIEVNEFGNPNRPRGTGSPWVSNQLIPGWQAGFISSFEQSDVSSAGLGCWNQYFPAVLGVIWSSYDQCLKGFDGLLDDDNNVLNAEMMDGNVAPQAIYWVYQFYGSMTGTRVPTSSPVTDLSGFATRDDTTGTMKVLVGRHKACSIDTARDPACPAGGPPVDVSVRVAWPYPGTSIHYTLQRIPDVGSGIGGLVPTLPDPSAGSLPVTGGAIVIPIPGFQDGDAYTVVMSP